MTIQVTMSLEDAQEICATMTQCERQLLSTRDDIDSAIMASVNARFPLAKAIQAAEKQREA